MRKSRREVSKSISRRRSVSAAGRRPITSSAEIENIPDTGTPLHGRRRSWCFLLVQLRQDLLRDLADIVLQFRRRVDPGAAAGVQHQLRGLVLRNVRQTDRHGIFALLPDRAGRVGIFFEHGFGERLEEFDLHDGDLREIEQPVRLDPVQDLRIRAERAVEDLRLFDAMQDERLDLGGVIVTDVIVPEQFAFDPTVPNHPECREFCGAQIHRGIVRVRLKANDLP